jgi:L-2-hydroxyglutarate oxidase LhgO
MASTDMTQRKNCDFLIIGAGIAGLSLGISLLDSNSSLKVIIAEKESQLGAHASGRNSGVLHAGFYYTPNSLKAKFCKEGNQKLTKLALSHKVPLEKIGKIVVTKDASEIDDLNNLAKRGAINGIDVEVLPAKSLSKFEPLAQTVESFLWSPTTAISSPLHVMSALRDEFLRKGGELLLVNLFSLHESQGEIVDYNGKINAKYYINAGGAQSLRIAHKINVGLTYAMIPFLGRYISVEKGKLPLKTLVYPVPHKVNPFLGIHLTPTIYGVVKIGPSALPVLGSQQYGLFRKMSAHDTYQSLSGLLALIARGQNDLNSIFWEEFRNLRNNHLVAEAAKLVPLVREITGWSRPKSGIRSQLVHLPTGKLVQDFIVEKHLNSMHLLNIVSPGWTSAMALADNIVEENFLSS